MSDKYKWIDKEYICYRCEKKSFFKLMVLDFIVSEGEYICPKCNKVNKYIHIQ